MLVILGLTVTITLSRDKMQDFATLGYAGAFLAMLLSNATLILPAPGLIFVFALGSSLHPGLVGICGALGATLGEFTGYMTGYSGLAALQTTAPVRRVKRWMDRNGTLTILTLSIVPNPLFDLAGIMAGTSHMPVWRFFSITFAGKSIQSTSIALAGALSLDWVKSCLAH